MNQTTIQKLLNGGLLISSLFCYLEWAKESAFLFQIESDLFFNAKEKAIAFAHPVILIPMIGQILLLITLFSKTFPVKLTVAGLLLIGLLVLLIFIIGIMAANFRIAISTLPFIILANLTIFHLKKTKTR